MTVNRQEFIPAYCTVICYSNKFRLIHIAIIRKYTKVSYAVKNIAHCNTLGNVHFTITMDNVIHS